METDGGNSIMPSSFAHFFSRHMYKQQLTDWATVSIPLLILR